MNIFYKIYYRFFEIYKIIPNTNYMISNYGNVYNFKLNKLINLKPKGNGRRNYLYFRVYNFKTKKAKNHYVHKIIMQLFDINYNELLEVGHIKPDRLDNRYPHNLKMISRKENMREMFDRKRSKL